MVLADCNYFRLGAQDAYEKVNSIVNRTAHPVLVLLKKDDHHACHIARLWPRCLQVVYAVVK